MEPSSADLSFEVDSQLLGELGERLVSKNYIALSELIKNSYDADANNIKIIFQNVKTKFGKIIIQDDGSGMNFNELKMFWMKVATPNKRIEPFSKLYGRRKTGEKGIGRFACRKLARKLTMTSIGINNNNEKEKSTIYFDWERYKTGIDLKDIKNRCEITPTDESTGLTLVLENLTEKWNQREFDILRRYIIALAIPKGIKRDGYSEDTGFQIEFNAPEFRYGEGLISEQFYKAGWGLLEGKIENNRIILELNAKDIGLNKYVISEDYDFINGIFFKIAIIPYYPKEYWMDPNTLTKKSVKDLEDDVGIKIYMNGFRVYPYGDYDDDWLGIDKDTARRKQPVDEIFKEVAEQLAGVNIDRAFLYHPSVRNLFGQINIEGDALNYFDVKVNREGFINNQAFEELKKAIRLSLEWVTLHYASFKYQFDKNKMKEKERELRKEIKAMKEEKNRMDNKYIKDEQATIDAPVEIFKDKDRDLSYDAIDLLEEEAIKNIEILPPKEKDKTVRRIKFAKDYLKSKIQFSDTEIDHLRTIASTGALMFTYTHEIRDIIHQLYKSSETIIRISKDIDENNKKVLETIARDMSDSRDRFLQQLQLFGLLKIDTDKEKLFVFKAIEKILDGFNYLIKKFGININDEKIDDSLIVGPIYRAEIYSIIINLLSNAIKASIAGHGRNIKIELFKDGEIKVFRIENEGIKLDQNDWENVFLPFKSDPNEQLYSKLEKRINDEDINILGQGSGLGLSIVKSLVIKNNGQIQFVTPSEGYNTCVEVLFQ